MLLGGLTAQLELRANPSYVPSLPILRLEMPFRDVLNSIFLFALGAVCPLTLGSFPLAVSGSVSTPQGCIYRLQNEVGISTSLIIP